MGTEEEEPERGEALWRSVRMFVRGVRGEGPAFAGTVQYRAARSDRAFKTVVMQSALGKGSHFLLRSNIRVDPQLDGKFVIL